MDLSVLIGYWEGAVSFLRDVEPDFLLVLSAPLRAVAIYISVRFAMSVLAVVLLIAGILLTELLLAILRLSARGAGYERMRELARIYVELEVFLVTIGLVSTVVPQEGYAENPRQSRFRSSSAASTWPRSTNLARQMVKGTLQGAAILGISTAHVS